MTSRPSLKRLSSTPREARENSIKARSESKTKDSAGMQDLRSLFRPPAMSRRAETRAKAADHAIELIFSVEKHARSVDIKKGMYARSVDIEKHNEVMAQLLLRLSFCASSKERNPDLHRSLENFSVDLSTPTQTTTTEEGINTSRIHSQEKQTTSRRRLFSSAKKCSIS